MQALTPKALELAKDGQTEPAVLQVKHVSKLPNGKFYQCIVSDGIQTMKARLVASVSKALLSGELQLQDNDIVNLDNYVCNKVGDEFLLLVSGLALLHSSASTESKPAANGSSDAARSKPDQAATPATVKQQPCTPVAVKQEHGQATPPAAVQRPHLTPGRTPTLSEEINATMQTPATTAATKGMGQSPSFSPLAVKERTDVQPIAALNPYDTHWCIKAKLVSKAPPVTFNRAGGQTRVFKVQLADAAGSQIQGTFWREAAEKYLDTLEEGKVYYFSKFSVKPANKQYAMVKNDYEVHFDNRTEVAEAADQTGISISHQLEIVPIDKLPRYIGRRMPVDVLGVVTQCGVLGTIKRKADSTELPRRDVTIADSSRNSVVLTLWADQATRAELDNCEGQLLQVTSVRVSDYNGCSLSAVTRSQVTLNPDGAAADAVRQWWESEGRGAALTPLGQSTLSGGAPRTNKLQLLSDVMVGDSLPSPDTKPTYHDVIVSVVQVQDSKTMYYLANPENGKKVEPRDGRFWCEAESRYVDVAQHKYVLTARVADATGETYVNMFNDQGQQLLGNTADELAAVRDSDESAFTCIMKGCKWSEWAMTLAARSREYNGETRMRYTVVRMAPIDYAQESQRLLQLMQPVQ